MIYFPNIKGKNSKFSKASRRDEYYIKNAPILKSDRNLSNSPTV